MSNTTTIKWFELEFAHQCPLLWLQQEFTFSGLYNASGASIVRALGLKLGGRVRSSSWGQIGGPGVGVRETKSRRKWRMHWPGERERARGKGRQGPPVVDVHFSFHLTRKRSLGRKWVLVRY